MRRTLAIQCVVLGGLLVTVLAPSVAPKERDRRSVSSVLAESPPELRLEVEALQYVLRPDELDELLALRTDYARRRWIDEYWELRDPVYTTAENEARAEHNRRLDYAMSEFSTPHWPPWDQRGEVHIRYGRPAVRQLVRMEVRAKSVSRPGEIWFYPEHEMYVLFEDAFTNGRYTYYLEHVQGPPGMRMMKIGAPIDVPMKPDLLPPEISITSGQDRFRKLVHRFSVMLEAMPACYSYDLEQNRVPFSFSVDGFRGGESIDRTEVNVEFMANFGPVAPDNVTNNYLVTAVFWDTDRNEVGCRERSLKVPVVEGAVDSVRLMPVQLVFSLPPGFYYMAVTLEDQVTGRISSYRTDVTCRDFESGLALSDILFASRITPAHRTSPFNRGAIEVIPHPLRRYGMPASVPVYFEVYNLALDRRGYSSYTVEYRIVARGPVKKRKSPLDVSSSFKGSGRGPYDSIYIMIGSENLWEGEFGLQVQITDDITGAEVSREAQFAVVEPD